MRRDETREELLHRRLDGDLTADEERRLRDAEAGDRDFAAEAAALSRLVEDLGSLPEEIEPPRDLLPEITARTTEAPRARRVDWRLAAALAAAIGAAFLIGRWTGTDPVAPKGVDGRQAEAPSAVAGDPATSLAAASSSLDRTRLELRRAFEGSRGSLPPETRRLVEDNLATIERAMSEIEAALVVDPANRDLGRLLVAYQVREIALLEKAHRAAARL